MQVGTAQNQPLQQPQQGVLRRESVSASLSVTTQIEAQAFASQEGGPVDSVLLSVGRTIDFSYARQVLETEVGQNLESALADLGIEGQAFEDLIGGAVDFSPEATATRIVDFASSFFGAFQANNADQEASLQIDGFDQLVRDAVQEGFAQSRDILEGIGKISQSVSQDIDRTFGLVMEGLDDFIAGQREAATSEAADAPPADATVDEPLVL